MREVELKSVVPDLGATLRVVESDPRCVLEFDGRLEDRRYDTPDRSLMRRDEVLRLRVMRRADERATLDWKGPTHYDGGYKVREELSTSVGDPVVYADILRRLGYVVTLEMDRQIRQFTFGGATLRFERYPRMDALVEVEGQPEAIERAIALTGLPRHGFTPERLSAFVARFEARTGERAALSDRALRGDPDAVPYSAGDA